MAENTPKRYPQFQQGMNDLTADLLNRMIGDLKTGDDNWVRVLGMLRDTQRFGTPTPPASGIRLAVIGESRKVGDSEGYGNMWMYEWLEIPASKLLTRGGDSCTGSTVPSGLDLCGDYRDSAQWFLDESGQNIPLFVESGGVCSFNSFAYNHFMLRGKGARFSDVDHACACGNGSWPEGSGQYDCCQTYENENGAMRFPSPCYCPTWASGFAVNIAELSLQLYNQPNNRLWPGINISSDSCIAQELIDFSVQPVQQGSLVAMFSIPASGKCDALDQVVPTDRLNVFMVGSPVDGCCAPPAAAGGSAVGGVAFQQDGTNALLRTDDFKYDNATQTLTAPNISGDGSGLTNVPTGGHPGYSPDTNREYMSPIHIGVDYGADHGTRGKFQPWYFPKTTRTEYISINGDSGGNNGQLNVAFYTNNNGAPGTKIDGTGVSLAGNRTGNTSVAYDVTFEQGWYWMGSCVNSGTIDIEHTTSGTSGMRGFFPRDISGFGSDWGCFQSSASTMTVLPETITIGELQSQTNNIPRIGLEFQSVS